MKKEKNYGPNKIIIVTFLLCYAIRFIDVLVIRLDETILNENIMRSWRMAFSVAYLSPLTKRNIAMP